MVKILFEINTKKTRKKSKAVKQFFYFFFCEGRNLRKIADFVTPSLYQWTTIWQIPTIPYTPFFTSQSFPPIMSSPCSYIFNQIIVSNNYRQNFEIGTCAYFILSSNTYLSWLLIVICYSMVCNLVFYCLNYYR